MFRGEGFGGKGVHHGGSLSEALPADDGQGTVSPAPSGALAQPAVQEPHEAKHRAQGHDYPRPEDQCPGLQSGPG